MSAARPLCRAGLLAGVWAGLLAAAAPGQEKPAVKPKEALVRGTVVDRQGRPVAGARVVRSDPRQRATGTTDDEGRFTLKTALAVPGFLFVEKDGFRFHGQRQDGPGPVAVTLARRDEPPGQKMATLPPALPRAERRALAGKLLEPYLARELKKPKDDDRLRALEALARLDPGRALEELERRPLKSAWYDAYVRRAAAQAVLRDSPDEARAIIESMKDPGFRAHCYFDLHDALPADNTAERRQALDQAILHARAVEGGDHRVIHLALAANRLWALGAKDRATELLREGQKVAKELPPAAWAGYARGMFAEDLARIDLPGALELLKDLKDPFEYVRHHGNLAQKLAGADPAGAERALDLGARRDQRGQPMHRDHYALRVCHRMAPADLARARKLAETIKDPYDRARAYAVMADALATARPDEARALLDHALGLLAKHVVSGQDVFNGLSNAAALAGLMVPTAERIDPALVPETFWRAVSLQPGPPREAENPGHVYDPGPPGALALVLARYDRGVALALVEHCARAPAGLTHSRSPHFQAAALADPRRAVALVEALPEGPEKDRARMTIATFLLSDGEEVEKAVHRTLGQWHVSQDDI